MERKNVSEENQTNELESLLKEDNVLELNNPEAEERLKQKEMQPGVQEVLDNLQELNPHLIVVIGIAGEQTFVLDSTKDISNTAYMTLMAQQMMFRPQP